DIVARDGIDDELDAVMSRFFPAGLVRREYGNAIPGHVDVPQDQGQSALPDGAKSYENQPSLKFRVLRSVHLRSGVGFSASKSSIILRAHQEFRVEILANASRSQRRTMRQTGRFVRIFSDVTGEILASCRLLHRLRRFPGPLRASL